MRNILNLDRLKKWKKKKRKAQKKSLAHKRVLKLREEAINNPVGDFENIYRICVENLIEVKEPLVLISQIQRSGGSLLSQLFDGHPQLHSHPSELMIGYPRKNIWPELNLNDNPKIWFDILFEDKVIEHFRDGYKKGKKADRTFSFIFLPSLQKKIFLKYISTKKSIVAEDIFHAYMTSYFSAWLNNQNYVGNKKYVTAFTPLLSILENNVESFFRIYPEGRIISIIRDPKNWYPSAIRHSPKSKKYQGIDNALQKWIDSTRSMIRNKEKWGDRICIIKFEDMVRNTESIMRQLADYLGIDFDKILLVPTFNKHPIPANTSFESNKTGIIKKVTQRSDTLSESDQRIIIAKTDEDYQKVLSLVSIQ